MSLATMSQTQGSHSLGFSVYTNVSTLLSTVKPYYAKANSGDLLIDDEFDGSNPRAYLNYYSKAQTFSRLIMANNYSELTSLTLSPYVNDVALAKSYNFTSRDYIAYDIEDWSLTPLLEQNAEALYTQLACTFVHAAGYKFALTPEIDVPGWGQFSQISWGCVDLVDLQEQFLTGSTSALIRNVTQLISVAKGANPNLDVFVQLDMQAGSQALLESDILAMSMISGVNGVIIQDLCASSSCNSELATLINYTTSINSSAQSNPLPTSGALQLPTSVPMTTTKSSSIVSVSGSGFTPSTIVNLGYTSNFPPNADAIMSATTSSSGSWSGTFTAPWAAGSYKMIAIDAKGVSGTATLVVTSGSGGAAATIQIPKTAPSSSARNVKVTVSGSGFTPGAHVNFGYAANFPPTSGAIVGTTVSSTGTWSATFTAPWNAGSYKMTALDAKGVSASATLVVT